MNGNRFVFDGCRASQRHSHHKCIPVLFVDNPNLPIITCACRCHTPR